MQRVAFMTLGCKTNQYDAEYMREQFLRAGYAPVDFDEIADVYVVNTCMVTATGERKSLKYVRQAARRNPQADIVVAGCVAQHEGEKLALPGVRLIVGGRNRKGVFTMTMMGSVDAYEPQTQAARKGAYLIEGACSHTDVAPWLEEEVKPQAANWHSLDDVAHTLDGCIAKMAKLDKSINTTYFRQLVM